ncbi:hypothetical protein BZA77DRAFT_324992 [Pyronema omphalodes]|nr:hypothetical protein BZA77DRAFT_324992 [Pyronema omphalodes]
MLDRLPENVLSTIFDYCGSFTQCAKLALVSKTLANVWRKHSEEIELAHTFDDDPRWCSEKFRFFAVGIIRAQWDDKPRPLPSTNEFIKAAYGIAGIINNVARAMVKEMKFEHRWKEYVLIKTLYMIWIANETSGAPCDAEYWVDTPEMVAYCLNERFQKLGYPSVKGLKEVTEASEAVPEKQVEEVCEKVADRIVGNKRRMLGDLEDMDMSGEEPPFPEEFYDDSDLDDLSELDDDEEYYLESGDEHEDGEWHAHSHTHACDHC